MEAMSPPIFVLSWHRGSPCIHVIVKIPYTMLSMIKVSTPRPCCWWHGQGGDRLGTAQLQLAVPGVTLPLGHALYMWAALVISLAVHEVSSLYTCATSTS